MTESAAPRFLFQLNPGRSRVALGNTLLNGRARSYHDPGYRTTLSIKSVVQGEALYRTKRSCYRVDDSSVVVFNHGQEYSLRIREEPPTETLVLFFQPGFVEQAAIAHGATSDHLLDHPGAVLTEDVQLFERSYPKRGALSEVLDRLAERSRDPALSVAWLEDRFYEAAEALLDLRDDARKEVDGFQSLRRSTREELYKRLHYARDLIESCYEQPLRVADVAGAACLSPFHFQRMFKLLFGRTPMQHLQWRRLERARHLLLSTDRDVTQVCLEVGFQSLGSFSALFRRRFGVPPSVLRSRASKTARSKKREQR